MRVLHLLKTSSGASWALRQMRELVRLGIDVHAAMPPGPLVAIYRRNGVVVHEVLLDFPVRSPRRIPGVLGACRALVSAVRPDLIHSHFVGTTLTMRIALGADHVIPRVFQVPGPLHLEHPFFRWAEIRTAGSADSWIASCRWTAERYRRSGVDARRVFLSFYGGDPSIFERPPAGKLRAELGVAQDTSIVGMVAFLYAPKRYLGQWGGIKGHEDFIDAIAIARRAHDRLIGVVVGGAWDGASNYERTVRRYAKRRCGDGLKMLGTRTDVAEMYVDFDVAVHPSHSENLGGAGESLALGVPTIATDVGGFPDIVHPGQTGWLVPPRNPERLAEVILDVIGNREEARRRADAGQRMVCQILDVRKTARQVHSIYSEILRGLSIDG